MTSVQGIAPFGADIAVLAYNTALEGSSPRPLNNLAKAAAAMPEGNGADAAGTRCCLLPALHLLFSSFSMHSEVTIVTQALGL